MFDTTLKRKRVIGLLLLAIMLALFLWFNRIPKLDIVQGDISSVTGAVVECFQGFCVDSDSDASLFSRWWDFSLTYFKLIALGMTFAFLVAGLTEVFLFPPGSHQGLFQRGLKGSAKGLLIGPAMNLCSACIVPIASAFRRKGAGIETTLAITQGSSTLNLPALIMAAMIFTPMLAGSRIGLSIVGALLLGPVVAKLTGQQGQTLPISLPEQAEQEPTCATWREVVNVGARDWLKASLIYLIKLGPLMVVAGFASAFVIQWISPDTVSKYLGDNPQGVAIAATLGLLINVPLLFEIPLVAGLLLVGMGVAPAATLLFAAAAGGPITFWGLAKVMPKKAVATFAVATWVLGAIAGLSILGLNPLIGGGDSGIQASVIAAGAQQEGHSARTDPYLLETESPSASAIEVKIASVSPSAASTLGEVMVIITGEGITEESTVFIDGQDATWKFLGPGTITAYVASHVAGIVDVEVTNPGGFRDVLAGGFTYLPPYFTDVAASAGIEFLHYRDFGTVFAFGGGVVVLDYDGDGDQDIYAISTADLLGMAKTDVHNALFQNLGKGKFVEIGLASGVGDIAGIGNGGCAADYDNDGFQDLFVANWGSSKLFRSNGDGTFEDVSFFAGLADPDPTYRSMGCAWGDYDRDGFVDLAVVRHMDESDIDAIRLRDFAGLVRPMALYHNNGDGTFAEVTSILGDLTPYKRTVGPTFGNVWGAGFQPAWVDFDNDGDSDLYVVNDFGEFAEPNVLWRNDGPAEDGSWRFTDISSASGAGVAMYGMGLAVADYDLDGDLDFFITNIGEAVLLSNNGDGKTFDRHDASFIIKTGEFRDQLRVTWGTVFFDYDNDGDEDLYIASGFLDDDPFNNRTEQPNMLLRNNGDGTFSDVSSVSGAADWGIARGVAYGDFNGDGCLDLYVANLGRSSSTGERAKLFQNSCDWGNNWLIVRLEGTQSNRDGIGARVTATAGGRTQIREVMAGSSSGSQNMLPVHFGLGGNSLVDTLTVRWPSGIIQTLTAVLPNQSITVVECQSDC